MEDAISWQVGHKSILSSVPRPHTFILPGQLFISWPVRHKSLSEGGRHLFKTPRGLRTAVKSLSITPYVLNVCTFNHHL